MTHPENDAPCRNCGRPRRVAPEHYRHPITTGADGLCWCPQCACPDCDTRHPHPALDEMDTPKGDAIQQSEGGKWHRVWWPKHLEDASNRFVTHVGMYRPDRDQRRPAAEVPEPDRCRRCFPTHVIPPGSTEGERP